MAAKLYRTDAGHAEIRAWCEARLDGRESSTVETAMGETRLVAAGQGRPKVVLVPGTNMGIATNLEVIGALAQHRRVVALDLPGQPGLSAADLPGRNRIPGYGRWLDEILARLGDGPFVLVGHSLGAAVVLAATPSDQVAGIVLVDPGGLVKATLGLGLIATSTAWFLRPSDVRSARLIERMQAPGRPAPPELTEWFTLVGRHTRSDGAPGPVGDEVLRRWQDTPRAIVVGEVDTFFPPGKLAPIARTGLGVDPIVIPDAGHLLPHEHPEAVVDAVLSLS